MEVYPGQMVFSKAGRDKGKAFIIIKHADEQYVYIVDGDLRRMDNPKKKKLKHLEITDLKSDFIANKIKHSHKITNADVRRCISTLIDERDKANKSHLVEAKKEG